MRQVVSPKGVKQTVDDLGRELLLVTELDGDDVSVMASPEASPCGDEGAAGVHAVPAGDREGGGRG